MYSEVQQTGSVIAPDDITIGLTAMVRSSPAVTTPFGSIGKYATLHGEIVEVTAVSHPFMLLRVLTGSHAHKSFDVEFGNITLARPDAEYVHAKIAVHKQNERTCTCASCSKKRRRWWKFWAR